jgi:PAS domain S-box-containing protein
MNRAKSILVVEDEIIIANNIQSRLQALGYYIPEIVVSGEEAIRSAKEHLPDLILMDIRLKGEIDGIMAAEYIRTNYDIPVVYLTAYADVNSLARAKITEPFGYIIKPFTERELHSNIEIALYKYDIEKQLKISKNRYRIVSELTSDFAYSLTVEDNTSLNIEWITDSCEDITGYNHTELNQIPWEEIVLAADRSIFRKMLKNVKKGSIVEKEYRITSKNGEVKFIRNFLKPISSQNNSKILEIYGAVQDITELKRIEKKMNENELRYEKIIKTLNLGFLLLDKNLKIIFANKKFLTQVGYNENDLIGKNFFSIITSNTFDVDAFNKAILEKEHTLTYHISFLKKSKNNNEFIVFQTNIFNENEDFQGCHITIMQSNVLSPGQNKKQSLFLDNNNPLAMIDLENNLIIETNELFSNLVEFDQDHLVGKSILELANWKDFDDLNTLLHLLQNKNQHNSIKLKLRKRSGSFLEAHAYPEYSRIRDKMILFLTLTKGI